MKRNILILIALAAAVGFAVWAIKYAGRGCTSPDCVAPETSQTSN